MTAAGQAALWRDWCAATGHDETVVTPAALTAHLTACPAPSRRARRERVRAVLTTAAADAETVAAVYPSPPPADSVIRSGEGWMTVTDALAAMDPSGWPAGAVARRDAWLLVLMGPLGMTRREAVAVTCSDVHVPDDDSGAVWPSVTGHDVPFAVDPTVCGGCITVRWLSVLAADVDGGRRAVEREIAADTARGNGHRCGDPLMAAWRAAETYAPSIDQHGWLGGRLSLRSISTIVRDRQSVAAPVTVSDGEVAGPVSPSATMGTRPANDPALDEALDRLDAALDETLTRVQGVLDAADSGAL